MKRQRSTKTALLLSGLSLLTCISMFVGSTYAWFTDSVTSEGNIIHTGTLEVAMDWYDGTKAVPAEDSDEWNDASTGPIFQSELWEPGYTEVRHIKISNEGSLALNYRISIVPTGEASALSDAIDVYFFDPAEQIANRQALDNLLPLGTLTESLSKIDSEAKGSITAGKSVTITIALKMHDNASNELQGLSIGSDFTVKLLATQMAYEEDSFGSDYDEVEMLKSYSEISSGKGESRDYMLTEDMSADNLIFFGNGTNNTIDLNENTITAVNTAQYLFGAQQGGTLTLNGEGTVNCGKGFMANKGNAEIVVNNGTYNMTETGSTSATGKFHSVIQNNAKMVINDGKFISNVEDAALFLATSNAILEINGGFFENTADRTPDLLDVGHNNTNVNRIIIKGGTFVNYNPLEDQEAYTGNWPDSYENFAGPWILVWDGYTVEAETQTNGDVWYTVTLSE